MRKHEFKRLLALFAAIAMIPAALCAGGCKNAPINKEMTRGQIEQLEPDEASTAAQTAFAARLLCENYTPGENVCLAPLSLYNALAMTRCGAAGETAAQMDAVLGGDADSVNAHMRWYADALAADKQLSSANSIWLTDNRQIFTPSDGFLQDVTDYYGAEVFSCAFPPEDCTDTVRRINAWTKKNTDGMIDSIIDAIPDSAFMYLVNAAAFDARWEEQYKRTDVYDGVFYAADGSEQDVKMMSSTEARYIEDDAATGFIKPYADGRYSFIGLLPSEESGLDSFIASLDGQRLTSLIASAEDTQVSATMPKFSFAFDSEQSEQLKALGMTDAFDDGRADFTAMGESGKGRITVGRVLHKTYIAVDENGTKAGAASAVEMLNKCAMIDSKYVRLDRPFVFVIYDETAKTPVFIGTVSSVEKK